jgi:hypothetical protein
MHFRLQGVTASAEKKDSDVVGVALFVCCLLQFYSVQFCVEEKNNWKTMYKILATWCFVINMSGRRQRGMSMRFSV